MIKTVENMDQMLSEPFSPEASVILYPRKLTGDFNALARVLWEKRPSDPKFDKHYDYITPDINSALSDIRGDAAEAAKQVMADLDKLDAYKTDRIELRLMNGDGGKEYLSPRRFHIDEGMRRQGIIFCCYAGAVTEGLRNEDATLDDEPYMNAFFYTAKENAKPFTFGLGHIWRQACRFPANGAKPFIHRTPHTHNGDPLRLTLAVK